MEVRKNAFRISSLTVFSEEKPAELHEIRMVPGAGISMRSVAVKTSGFKSFKQRITQIVLSTWEQQEWVTFRRVRSISCAVALLSFGHSFILYVIRCLGFTYNIER